MQSEAACLPTGKWPRASLSDRIGPTSKSDLDVRADQQAAATLINDVAGLLDMPASLVLDVMCTVPENMLTLLDSPQGWKALAGFVAAELGVSPPDYAPGVH